MLRRLSCVLIGLILIVSLVLPTTAQDAFAEYSWQEADIALRYPADWDEPLPLFNTEKNANVLQMAQDFVTSPSRPPAIPIITFMLIPDIEPETDLYGLMEAELSAIDIRSIGPIPSTLLEQDAIATNGTDRNSILFGLGRIVLLDDGATTQALMMIGRASAAQRDTFTSLFTNVANSLVLGANRLTTAPEYGVLWHTESLPTDGANAFLDVRGLTNTPDGNLLLIDSFTGIVTLDAVTGAVIDTLPIDTPELTTTIATDADGTIYVGDVLCSCVRVFVDGEDVDEIGTFNLDAPRSIVVADDGTIYATDFSATNEVFIHAFTDAGDEPLFFEDIVVDQPLLTIDQLGQLLALVDNTTVYALDETGFSPLYDLQTGRFVATAITINNDNRLVVATEQQGILIFDGEGNEINRVGRIVAGFPLAGELVSPRGVAAAPDGTIFWADSDGTFGNVTAVSLSVESGRVGDTRLQSGVAVRGELTEDVARQIWTFDGVQGERITLVAVSDFEAINLNLAFQILLPDGEELVYVDDIEDFEALTLPINPFDPQVLSLELPQDGEYTVLVEALVGTGRYRMGLSKSQMLDFAGGELSVEGLLSEVLPVQEWVLAGRGGQSITITLEAQSGTLDPIVFLLNPRDEVVAQNDDAENVALGLNSQIVNFSIQQNGDYIIQAARFFGEGTYRLTIEQN